jgi:hypothetical protein
MNGFKFAISALVAVLIAGGTLRLFRFDVALSPNGSSVSRDRITGELEICSHANECRRVAARAASIAPKSPEGLAVWEAAKELADAQFVHEQNTRAWTPAEIAQSNDKIERLDRKLGEQMRQADSKSNVR